MFSGDALASGFRLAIGAHKRVEARKRQFRAALRPDPDHSRTGGSVTFASGCKLFRSFRLEPHSPVNGHRRQNSVARSAPVRNLETKTRMAIRVSASGLGAAPLRTLGLCRWKPECYRQTGDSVTRNWGWSALWICRWICGETELSSALCPRVFCVFLGGACCGSDAAHGTVARDGDERGGT